MIGGTLSCSLLPGLAADYLLKVNNSSITASPLPNSPPNVIVPLSGRVGDGNFRAAGAGAMEIRRKGSPGRDERQCAKPGVLLEIIFVNLF